MSSVRSAVGRTSTTTFDNPNHVTVFVEAVVVTDGLAPVKVVLTVPEAVGVLVIVGLPQALRGDVDIVISGTLEPLDNEAKTPYRALKFARNSSL